MIKKAYEKTRFEKLQIDAKKCKNLQKNTKYCKKTYF